VDLDPGGVQLLGLGEQKQPGHCHADTGIVERPDELRNRAGGHHRVRVQEDEHVARGPTRSEIGTPGEAEILSRCDKQIDRVALGLVAGVVDNDDLVDLAGERIEQPGKGVP
jgi:hypothetical protein